MRSIGFAAVIIALSAVGVIASQASTPTTAVSPASQGADAPELCAAGSQPVAFTCHEDCRIRCIGLYPGDRGRQDLCTWSCIDQQCGGGPFPVM
jgi:hypothetical protein